ncbi:MAG: G8 domain-containing protein [Chitinophagaceae bacterium]|nr:G8 domain-containing protein [Chitinophagaceae bacterium]
MATGNWSVAGTWSGGVPAIGDDVIIPSGFTVTLNANSAALLSLTIDAGGTLATTGTNTLTATTITVNGTYTNGSTGAITGTMTVNGTYKHNFTTVAGTIPTATWASGSTCEIIGYTAPGNGTTPGGLGQTFHHFTWNCSSQTNRCIAWAASMVVNGNYTVQNTNADYIYFTDGSNLSVAIAGNYIQTGSEMRFSEVMVMELLQSLETLMFQAEL